MRLVYSCGCLVEGPLSIPCKDHADITEPLPDVSQRALQKLTEENERLTKDLREKQEALHMEYLAAEKWHKEADKLQEALENMIDPDPCAYDHDGFCQTHASSAPCKNEVAQKLLAR